MAETKVVFRSLQAFYGEGGRHFGNGEEITPDEWNILDTKEKAFFNPQVVPIAQKAPAPDPGAVGEGQISSPGLEDAGAVNAKPSETAEGGVQQGGDIPVPGATGQPAGETAAPPTHETIGQHIAEFWKKVQEGFEALKDKMEELLK